MKRLKQKPVKGKSVEEPIGESGVGTAPISTNVSTLKTHLGRYLKTVKHGQEVIVYDRQLPVAAMDGWTSSSR